VDWRVSESLEMEESRNVQLIVAGEVDPTPPTLGTKLGQAW
jgi:hypothetical protein